jgi:drug/metabolite transporter (DMT)-like permease
VAVIALLVLSWGSTFAAVKVGLDSAPPLLFAGMRALAGGAVMTLAAAALGSDRPRLRDHTGVYLLLALLNVVLFFGLQTLAIGLLPSGLAAVLIYLQPVLVGLLAWPILGERLTGGKVAGLLLGFGGIVAVSAGAFQGHASGAGIGYAVGAALAWALGTVYFKTAAHRVPALWAVGLPFLIGGSVLTVLGLVLEGGDVTWNAAFAVAFAYASLVGTALSWFLWFSLVSSGQASRAATYVFFVPLVSLVIGALGLGESLSVSLLVGAALVVAGVYLVNRPSGGNAA